MAQKKQQVQFERNPALCTEIIATWADEGGFIDFMSSADTVKSSRAKVDRSVKERLGGHRLAQSRCA